MKSQDLVKFNLPDNPGVYFFRKGREILYIGKATSLRDRVRSYFANDLISTRGPRIIDMVTLADRIDFQNSDSVLEALILESALIKKHKPKYNIKEKDDKSFNYVVITKEEFPRVLLIRGKELTHNLGLAKDLPISETYGPFPNGTQLREALKIIKKLFPYFDTKQPVDINKKPSLNVGAQNRLNVQINIFPDIFSGKVSREDYLTNIRHIKLFFEGKKGTVIKSLEKEMRAAAKKLEFEKAEQIKKTIFALKHIRDVSLISDTDEEESFDNQNDGTIKKTNSRIESYDIAHTAGKQTVGVMTVMEDGEIKKSDYRKFIIKTAKQGDDYGALKEVLDRRLRHGEWPLPTIIVIDGGKGQLNIAKKVLGDLLDFITLVSVVKDDKHRAKDILTLGPKLSPKVQTQILKLNQETHRFAINFHREKRGKLLK